MEKHLSQPGLPPLAVCERVRLARDARYDGRFFIGVLSTGIYCRPVCPARSPAAANIRYYATAAAAQEAGFRPCLRCRPETAPGSAAWRGTSAVVSRALRLIETGALDDGSVAQLAERLGISSRHLDRLFAEHVGASPLAVAATRRLHFAKRLLDETGMPVSDIAMASGFGSVRQFNDLVRRTWQRSPRELRKLNGRGGIAGVITLKLPARAPFDGAGVLAWLGPRAIPGVESVQGGYYERKLPYSKDAFLRARPEATGIALELAGVPAAEMLDVVSRAKRLFDLGCDPDAVRKVFVRDAALKPLAKKFYGMRIPGCWDAFELTVRCVLGQQVSVAAANTLAARLVERFGKGMGFPSAQAMQELPIEKIGLPGARAEAIRALARARSSGQLDFDAPDLLREQLLVIKGIGPWTAEYVCLRAAGDPDAFPAGDLALRKAMSTKADLIREKELAARSEDWRPWRGYAALMLWQSLAKDGKASGG